MNLLINLLIMVTKQKNDSGQILKTEYLAPHVITIRLRARNVLCASGDGIEIETMNREEELEW